MAKKKTDFLELTNQASQLLQQQSDGAMDVFARTVSSLELINQESRDKLTEIDSYIQRLAIARNDLVNNMTRNNTVIQKLAEIFGFESPNPEIDEALAEQSDE